MSVSADIRAGRLRQMMSDPDPWWRNRLSGLAQLVESIKPKSVLEIGCCRGHSTEVFLLYAETVVALDPWPIEDEIQEFVARCGWYPGLEIVKGCSPQNVPDRQFDLIYIDGEHTYQAVAADIRASLGRCRFLAGHDWNIPDVRRAVTDYYTTVGIAAPTIFPDTSWMLRMEEGRAARGDWLISIPAWGNDAVGVMRSHALPSLRAALDHAGIKDADVIIHTEMSRRFIGTGFNGIQMFPVPYRDNKYHLMSECHREAIALARPGQNIMLMCADMVVSREVFAASERRIGEGKRIILVHSSRTASEKGPPIGEGAEQLLAWSMTNAHRYTLESFFGGRGNPPSTMLFSKGKNVTARAFNLHPLVVVKDRDLSFEGTIDQDLVMNFKHSEIHVVTDCREMSATEQSDPDLPFTLAPRPFDAEMIARWARKQVPINHWIATHRIIVQGDGDTDDVESWNEVLRLTALPEPPRSVSPPPRPRYAAAVRSSVRPISRGVRI